jgi:hypothetical protein
LAGGGEMSASRFISSNKFCHPERSEGSLDFFSTSLIA